MTCFCSSTPLLDAANNRLNNPGVSCNGDSTGLESPTVNQPNYSGRWYPEAGTCIESSDSLPNWIDEDDLSNSKEDCCNKHYPLNNGCMEQGGPINNNMLYYYPDYGRDGDKAECLNVGKMPSWMNQNMLTSSSYECCTTYFPYQKEECNQGTDRYPYYPDFKTSTCVKSRDPPKWMAGDYLQKNLWLCCETFFSHDTDLLLTCQSS